ARPPARAEVVAPDEWLTAEPREPALGPCDSKAELSVPGFVAPPTTAAGASSTALRPASSAIWAGSLASVVFRLRSFSTPSHPPAPAAMPATNDITANKLTRAASAHHRRCDPPTSIPAVKIGRISALLNSSAMSVVWKEEVVAIG